MMVKMCKKCGVEKPANITFFHKHGLGLRGTCIECRKKEWTKPKTIKSKKCLICSSVFEYTNAIKYKKYCSTVCLRKANRNQVLKKNPNYEREYQKKPKIRHYQNEYQKEYRRTHPNVKEAGLRRQKKAIDTLSDWYIRQRFSGLKNLDQNIIELKRIHLTLKRKQRERKNEQPANP